MRKFALCSLFLVTTTACTTPATPVIESTVPTPTIPDATPRGAEQYRPVTVNLELWLPEHMDPQGTSPAAGVLAQRLEDFENAYPTLQVSVVVKKAHGRGGLIDFLRTARDAAPSVLPDLAVLNTGDLETAARGGLIQPLDPLISPAKLDERFPFASALGSVDGQTYGFVIAADLQHAAYRPALFDTPPISWSQIISLPATLIFPAGGPDRQVDDATLIQYLSLDGKVTDPDGKPTLDKAALTDVLDFYLNCVTAGAVSPATVLNVESAGQSWERFQAGAGSIAIVQAGRYWAEVAGTAGAGVVAAAPIPTRDGQPLSIARGLAITMVARDAARQEQAILLLEWLLASDHSAQWTQAAGYLPATPSSLRLWELPDEDKATLQTLMEAAVPPPRPEAMTVVGQAMHEALEAVLTGQSTPEEAAAAAMNSLDE